MREKIAQVLAERMELLLASRAFRVLGSLAGVLLILVGAWLLVT